MRIQRGRQGVQAPLKNHKNIEFLSNWFGSPEKSQSYQASIQCWAIISMPAKRHLNGISMAGQDGLLIVVFGSSLPSSTKKTTTKKQSKLDPTLTKFSRSAHGFKHEYLDKQPRLGGAWESTQSCQSLHCLEPRPKFRLLTLQDSCMCM